MFLLYVQRGIIEHSYNTYQNFHHNTRAYGWMNTHRIHLIEFYHNHKIKWPLCFVCKHVFCSIEISWCLQPVRGMRRKKVQIGVFDKIQGVSLSIVLLSSKSNVLWSWVVISIKQCSCNYLDLVRHCCWWYCICVCMFP